MAAVRRAAALAAAAAAATAALSATGLVQAASGGGPLRARPAVCPQLTRCWAAGVAVGEGAGAAGLAIGSDYHERATASNRSAAAPADGVLNAVLLLSYDGSRFAGTYYNRNDPAQAAQPNRTVEGALESALVTALGAVLGSALVPGAPGRPRVSCLSRTDKGVSAVRSAAVCFLPGAPAVAACDDGAAAFASWAELVMAATNARLQDAEAGASVLEIRPLAPRADVGAWTVGDMRLAAQALSGPKRYEYLVRPGADVDSENMGNLEGLLAWHVPEALDMEAMRAAAANLEGEHDFRAFTAKHGHARDTRRHLRELTVAPVWASAKRGGQSLELFRVRAVGESFLYRMVRYLVFCLVTVGRGERAPAWASWLLDAGERSSRLYTPCRRGGLRPAPAHGLTLAELQLRDWAAPVSSAATLPGGS